MSDIGKRIIDIGGLIDQFEAKEGDVEHITGQTGQGKTYEATRRALNYLRNGEVVYTTWRLNLPDYFDQRDSFWHVFWNTVFFKKHFFRFEYKKNWHFVNLDDYLDVDGVFETERFSKFLASRTDCIFMLDEGQDVFDSHQRAGRAARQSITRTRHMHKKLIIISQRAQAVDVTARANVSVFYKCEAIAFPFLPKFFRVYETEEVDNASNYPLWVRLNSNGEEVWKAPVYHSGFAKKEVYAAYDSWYMRKNMQKSQNVHVSAYEVSTWGRLRLLFRTMGGKKSYPQQPSKKIEVEHLQKNDTVIILKHVKPTVIESDDKPESEQGVVFALPSRRKRVSKKTVETSQFANEVH